MYILFNVLGFIFLAIVALSAIAMLVSKNSYDSDQAKFWARVCLGSMALLAACAIGVWSTQENYATELVERQIAEELNTTVRNVHMGQPVCVAIDRGICYSWRAEYDVIIRDEVTHGTVLYNSEGDSTFLDSPNISPTAK